MAERELLNHIKEYLKEENIDSSYQKSPHPKLVVDLGEDAKKRKRVLELTAQQQMLLPDIVKSKKPKSTRDYVRIQFKVEFPFTASIETAIDTGSVIHFVNRMLELPGIEFSESDHKIYFRYVLLSISDGVTKDLMLAIVGNILMFLDVFSEIIEKIADGSLTFNEMLQQVLAIAERIPKYKE